MDHCQVLGSDKLEKLEHSFFRMILSKAAKNSAVLPSCLYVTGVQKTGDHPVSGGGYADVWRGQFGETPVALKVLRFFGSQSDLDKVQKVRQAMRNRAE